jgi:GNAT superfamily N-acetyltransferase
MLTIREICAGDASAIPEVNGGPAWHGGPAKWSKYWREHQGGLRAAIAAVDDGRIIGYGSLVWRSQHPPFAAAGIPEIQDMVVADGGRRRGVATAMIADFERRARLAGHSTLGIGFGLFADYGAAQRLYVRLGYVPDGGGITWNNKPVIAGDMVRVDDDLALWLTKSLR